MVPRILLAALMAAIATASPCRPPPPTTPTPTLPSTGASDLPAPAPGLTLKAIALGHGIQNYTCANGNASIAATGALAVLYDATSLYPGTPGTGLSEEGFRALTTTALWSQNLPLNLLDPAAANPGSPSQPNNGLPASSYGAAAPPFPQNPADLKLGNLPSVKFLGVHYFDRESNPTFDLPAKNLMFSVKLKMGLDAPASSDKGVLGTGAVKWLLLDDNGKGLGNTPAGVVYRVMTAGGVGRACSVDGSVPQGSSPYTALYYFYSS